MMRLLAFEQIKGKFKRISYDIIKILKVIVME